MDEEQQWAITLYVPDGLLPALNGEGVELRGILDGASGLEFIVPRWWEGSHTVRLGALKPADEPRALQSGSPVYPSCETAPQNPVGQ
jgi:hypothetical protein